MTVLLDPTAGPIEGKAAASIETVPRPASLDGLTVALLDISKPRGAQFLDQLEKRLGEQGVRVQRYAKPTFAKPAPVDLRHEIASNCDAVIEALAD